MGAVEHLKALCCLGLPPESAMVAVAPLLHEIIPHGWSRGCLVASDGTDDGNEKSKTFMGSNPPTVQFFFQTPG